uniref:Glutaredoxin-dependent peroxiredoxin n=1 Tax=Nelumbo nucifera TaxID=4432 RepID=A0A822YA68_NELNU|nr:TPA_asm: hypothetical protein HUJ06_029353 [Nelumbo nucifera]
MAPISVGDVMTSGTLGCFDENDDLQKISSIHSLATGKKFILFGIPSAFTPTCSEGLYRFLQWNNLTVSINPGPFNLLLLPNNISNRFLQFSKCSHHYGGQAFERGSLQKLKQGVSVFELASSPITLISSMICPRYPSSLGGISPALKKVEHFSVQKVTGNGGCLFRAPVKGMAINKGITLTPRERRDDVDELRMVVKEVICYDDKERSQYEEALVAITVDESLSNTLKNLIFWEESLNYWCYQSCASS